MWPLQNVSKITASRAFSQPDKVHPKLSGVFSMPQIKSGYVVNAAARSLRAKSSRTIGIGQPGHEQPVFGGLAKRITPEAYNAGMTR